MKESVKFLNFPMYIAQLNKVDEDNCRMKIEETLSETDHQEGNNDNKVRFNNISLHLFLRI